MNLIKRLIIWLSIKTWKTNKACKFCKHNTIDFMCRDDLYNNHCKIMGKKVYSHGHCWFYKGD